MTFRWRISTQLCRGVRQIGIAADIRQRAQAAIRRIDAASSFSSQLRDTFNRQHNYLRISLTERCNLRCFYCMPAEGVKLSPEGKLLTNDEVLHLATLFVKNGVTKIRLTGGEPTIRKGILDIVNRLNNLRKHGLRSIGMTSNGLALHRKLPELVANGLTHLNLSLDTLDPFKFQLITRRSGHDAVLKALDTALRLPLVSIKINVVIIKNLNDSEVLDFVEMTKDLPISVRFIEFMPFTGNKWDKKKMVPSSELLEHIRAHHPNIQRAPDDLNDTARSWAIPGFKGSLGFISSMSDHFCKTCNRLRLTADGQIKVCLFDPNEVSLRDKLRSGASDEELFKTIGMAVKGKKEKHGGMENIDVVTNRPMILIGGLQRTSFPKKALSISILALGQSITTPLLQNIVDRPTLRFYSTTRLSHLDKHGRASMVDVGDKPSTKRSATASGQIFIPKVAYDLVTSPYPLEDDIALRRTGAAKSAIIKSQRKGDALTIAQLAAIMGAKQTSNLIPLCHPIPLSKIDVKLLPLVRPYQYQSVSFVEKPNSRQAHSIKCIATVTCEGKTGVEMEALTAVSIGLLTVWDMLKAVAGKEMEIGEIMVVHKSGGQSGDFDRQV